jgi:predicted ester cyclase
MTSTDANKQVVTEYVDAFNRADYARLRDLFTPDAIIYGVLGSGGLDIVEPIWRELHHAFGIHLTVDAIVAEGDTVAVRYNERGTFTGAFRGFHPTGKPYESVAIEWFVVKDGRIHRRWAGRDSAAQARQIGLPLA